MKRRFWNTWIACAASLFVLSSCQQHLPSLTPTSTPFATPTILPASQAHIGPNLLQNGDFESGRAVPWQGLDRSTLTTSDVHSGQYALKDTGQDGYLQQVKVKPGQTYVFSAWFKWLRFEGQGWGYDYLQVGENGNEALASLPNPHILYPPGQWNRLALTFTPSQDTIELHFGINGPKDSAEIYFDDLQLQEKSGNARPSLYPSATVTTGTAPFAVRFQANATDADGAIQYYSWDFGDGSNETISNPVHSFTARGLFPVRLTVWDNEGASDTKTLQVQISDERSPLLTITSPADGAQLKDLSVNLSGQVSVAAGRTLERLSWDNVSTDQAGLIDLPAPESTVWETPHVPLKPGRNEILLTASDDQGRSGVLRLQLVRPASAPVIHDLSTPPDSVRVYEKYELTFDLDTVADNPFYIYTQTPPPGVPAASGVTVEGVFTSPSGKTLRQPAFFMTDVDRSGPLNQPLYLKTARSHWALRFSPQESGRYQLRLQVQDASGTLDQPIAAFTAAAPVKPGFIRVSARDPRYFEFSDGQLYLPLGPARGPDYSAYAGSGQNFERPWMAASGAYSTVFARWLSSAQGQTNEGWTSNLSYKEHYPGHELSQEIFYPQGFRMWLGFTGDGQPYRPQFTAGTTYLVKLRLKTEGIKGPVDSSAPFGLLVKTHAWPSDSFIHDLRGVPSIIPPVTQDNDWSTLLIRYTATQRDSQQPYLSLYLDNVSAGIVYIDEFSVREILPDGSLGHELIVNPRADLHTYVEQAAAAALDQQVQQGEQNGIYFQFVVFDKNDWVPNHLAPVGIFHDYSGGFYQPRGSKERWLQEQWWRYIAARWGYSTAVHSWELNNEGPPNDPAHYRMAQDFAAFMHAVDAQPHLVTTSFWNGYPAAFWIDTAKFPDIGYADLHSYASPSQAYDPLQWQLDLERQVYAVPPVKPVLLGESGLGDSGSSFFKALSQPNPGIWYHQLLWLQLGPSPIFDPNYWWSDHLSAIDKQGISQAFYRFIQNLDLNQGGYADLAAASDNPQLLALGQKYLTGGSAYLWIVNRQYTWRNVMAWDGVQTPAPQSGAITLTLAAGKSYTVEWWDTDKGVVSRTETLTAGADGKIVLKIDALLSDVAVKMYVK